MSLNFGFTSSGPPLAQPLRQGFGICSRPWHIRPPIPGRMAMASSSSAWWLPHRRGQCIRHQHGAARQEPRRTESCSFMTWCSRGRCHMISLEAACRHVVGSPERFRGVTILDFLLFGVRRSVPDWKWIHCTESVTCTWSRRDMKGITRLLGQGIGHFPQSTA